MTIFLLTLLGVGFAVGVLSAASGIGWGVLIVPLLLLHPEISPKQAVTISLFAFLLNGAVASFFNFRAGFIIWQYALWLGAGGIAGAVVGSQVLRTVPPNILERVIGIVIIIVGLKMLFLRTSP